MPEMTIEEYTEQQTAELIDLIADNATVIYQQAASEIVDGFREHAEKIGLRKD
jgi:hypothetical protein